MNGTNFEEFASGIIDDLDQTGIAQRDEIGPQTNGRSISIM